MKKTKTNVVIGILLLTGALGAIAVTPFAGVALLVAWLVSSPEAFTGIAYGFAIIAVILWVTMAASMLSERFEDPDEEWEDE